MTRTDARARLRCRRGFTINGVLILILVATVILSTSVFLNVAEEASAGAAARRARLAAASEAVLAEMQERLLAGVQQVSGALWDSDLAIMNAGAVDLSVPDDQLAVDPARTGWRVIEVRENERIPHDEVPVTAWTDQPRLSYSGTPPIGGLVAARTLVVAVYVTLKDRNGGTYRVRRNLAISQIPPHQHALYVAGDGELCSSATPNSSISGPVRIDGTMLALSCSQIIRYTGGIDARDGISVAAPSAHYVVGTDGQLALASVSRVDAESNPAAALAPWGGRVRIAAAFGGAVGTGRLSTAAVAGSGECDDVPAAGSLACDGAARYFPSVQVRRVTSGPGPGFSAVCGAAYEGDGCDEVIAALGYVPWPFSEPQAPGAAAADPADPGVPWRGLLPDARREARCTASVGGNPYRTARCPTNVYGFRIDVGALPAVAGGVLSIRRATGQAAGANPSGAQEIVLLINATSLAGPLTIHSEIPVYIAGSFNTAFRATYNGPPPAKIHAPRIVVLPNEAVSQLQTSSVWDSVARAGSTTAAAAPLRAESNVTIGAVLRSGYCPSRDGEYFGGVWEGVPAVLGDWRAAGLRIIGAVEASEASSGCSAFAAPLGSTPSGTPTTQPASRSILYDDRLLHPYFQPPGAWGYGNMVYTGPSAVPGHVYARQVRAIGGTVAVRRVRDTMRGLPPIPDAVPVRSPGAYPAAPLPLP